VSGKCGRTKSTNDLRLELELALEATSEEGDMTLSVVAGVRDIPDVVEHGAARAAQNNHQGDELPQPAVLNDRANERPGSHQGCDDSSNSRECHDDGEPVCGSVDFGNWTSWQVSADPVPDRLGRWCTGVTCKYGGMQYIL
jgi:hypothetical protein